MTDPNKCIFCGNSDLTKSPIWPTWIKNVVPIDTEPYVLTFEERFFQKETVIITKPDSEGTNDFFNTRVNVYCNSCEDTWMKRIDEHSKLPVEKLLKGDFLELNSLEHQSLTNWITLRTMLSEFAFPETKAIPERNYSQFYETRVPPSGWKIWIGRNDISLEGYNRYTHHYGTIINRDTKIIDNRNPPPSYQFSTFSLGRLFIHAVTFEDAILENIKFDDRQNNYLKQIWPVLSQPLVEKSLDIDLYTSFEISDFFRLQVLKSAITAVVDKNGPEHMSDRLKDLLFHNAFLANNDDGCYNINVMPNNEIIQADRESLQRKIELFRKSNPKIPPIRIGFRNNLKLGARATKWKGFYCIGINIGTYYLLWNLYSRMMAHPDVLKEIGDLSKEVASLEEIKMETSQITDFDMIDAHNIGFIAPQCLERKLIAEVLKNYALDALLFHEFQHINGGHNDFKDILRINKDSIGRLDNLCLEYDADCFLGNKLTQQVLYLCKNAESTTNNSPLLPYYRNTRLSIKLLTFSVYSLFRITSHPNSPAIPSPERKDLPSNLRQLIFIEMMRTICEIEKCNLTPEELSKTIGEAINESENAFSLLSRNPTNSDTIKLAFSNNYHEFLQEIRTHWKNVRPLIAPYAYSKLAE